MTKPAWDILVAYADVAWRDRVTVALGARPVRTMTAERCLARPSANEPTLHAIVLQAGTGAGCVGPETIEQIRGDDPGPRLVVIAPTGGSRILDAFRLAGADDGFVEPASATALAKRMQRSLLRVSGPIERAMPRDSITTEVASAHTDSPILLNAPIADHATLFDEDEFDPNDNARRLQDIRTRLRQAYLDSTKALVAAAEAKEKYARRHSINVSNFTQGIGRRLGLPGALVEQIKTAAILHDVGKIGIPDSILTKPGRLTAEEFEIIKQHPQIAMDILGHVSFLEAELPMILHHHERYDGTGYPEGLAGEDIPLGARVIAVADAVEVMFARRSYKNPYEVARVREELRQQAGRQFDPPIAAAAIEWMGEPQTARILRAKSANATLVHPAKPVSANQLDSLRNTV